MFRAGPFVAEHLSPVAADAVQPNGVDLTVEAVFEQVEPGYIGRDGKTVGGREAIEPEVSPAAGADGGDDGVDGDDDETTETFVLQPGGYILRYGETISVPREHVGFVLPRSSLMRNSCMLNTAVWDAGYEGRGEGLLQVHHEVELERGARAAQFVLAAADHEGVYEGSYQYENL